MSLELLAGLAAFNIDCRTSPTSTRKMKGKCGSSSQKRDSPYTLWTISYLSLRKSARNEKVLPPISCNTNIMINICNSCTCGTLWLRHDPEHRTSIIWHNKPD